MAKRVYFAFHYQDVIDFRANVIRNHNAVSGVEKAGYYDHSIWEESKKKGELALKRMINAELDNSSATAVLVGSETWNRRWVQYEIMKSLERGNYLLGIGINQIKGKDGMTKAVGPSPMDNLALSVSDDGRTVVPNVWNGSKWSWYGDLVQFTIPQQPLSKRGRNLTLGTWFPVYDWELNEGYKNFSTWIDNFPFC